MITEEKKEEVKAAADIVEVVGDYVKLKKSGSGFVGLCPYHNEKTPSFHVTPRLGIFKCFGCSESGDVIKFLMDQEGISFTEAVRQLADRYGVFIPEEDVSEEVSQMQQQHEGILHALKFAGLFYYRNLIENDEAEQARSYLEKRGYPNEVIRHFGLGYAPEQGDALYRAAMSAGIDTEYLLEGGLIRESQRGEGFYDVFRGRLMFPIFNPAGKVIAFAGRVLGKEKTAKYINTAQTSVYNKSEVVYGLNFSRNDIRKQKEVILVEGYTDVITLHQHEIKNVVASSGTALTAGQVRLLKRYGEKMIMIYDSDVAGQKAMQRGIEIALAEGMDVELLELPEGDDPDSFVKQFGKESFLAYCKEESKDFVSFLILKAEVEGKTAKPTGIATLISEVLEAIAVMPDTLKQQVFVQYLHTKTQKFRNSSDRELFEELDRIRARRKVEDRRSKEREERQRLRTETPVLQQQEKPEASKPAVKEKKANSPHFEREMLRLLITYGNPLVEYVGNLCNERVFEDDELREFFRQVIEDFKEGKKVEISRYTSMPDPYPKLVADVLMEQHSPSERHHEKTGKKIIRDQDIFGSARSTLKALQRSYYLRKREEVARELSTADPDRKIELQKKQAHIQREYNKIESTPYDDLYPSVKHNDGIKEKKQFEYKMKSERE